MIPSSKEGQILRDSMNLPLKTVKHTEGSSKYRAKKFDSWKDFWESKNTSNSFPAHQICDCCQRMETTFVGGHVTVIDTEETYIYPVCENCNNKYGDGKHNKTFQAKSGLLVPFNPKEDAKLIRSINK